MRVIILISNLVSESNQNESYSDFLNDSFTDATMAISCLN